MKRLYYGDNLQVLRENIPDECIDLIYLDPPFNSKANYNILFKNTTGESSEAQITAFEDTWTWGIESERFLDEIENTKGELYQLLDLLVRTLGKNSLSAYLVMMAIRLIELHRVLKSTGSLYLHCDTTASHYLKMILDLIFDARNYRNQITWKRTSSHSDAKKYARVTDIIFYYVKSNQFTWNPLKLPYTDKYINQYYCNIDSDGRRFQFGDLTNTKTSRGYFYKLLDCDPPGNGWRMPESRAQEWLNEGRIAIPPTGKTPRYKRYLDEVEGKIIADIWDDIPPINSQAKEALGYPTQKPQSLLERIIKISSNKDDIVLDPFCGCGTAIHAAENLGRNWIGKGGKNINASMIRDLRGTMETNKSDIGLFVTLTPPTQPMIKEAASSGFYKAGNGRNYAKVQILTIEELLTGQKRPEFFDMKQGELTFKKAQRENQDIAEQGELF